MRFPIPQEKWTQSGYRWLSWTGEAYHNAVDINTASGNNDRGEPVFCHDWGIVHKIDQSSGGYGKQVIVQHSDRFSRYAHLDTILVKEGEAVSPFTQIGTMGTTGASTSAHLHFELPTNKLITYLKSIRPNDWFRFYPNGKSKAWVEDMYLNPMTNCTQTVRLLNIFYGSPVATGYSFIPDLKAWVYQSSGTQLKLETSEMTLGTLANTIPWVTTTFMGGVVGKMIDQSWLRYWILSRASGYDAVALHIPEHLWDGGNVIAYTPVPKQLGIQPIITRIEEGTDPRYAGFCNGDAFIGKLRHELSHALFNSCGQWATDTVHQMEAQGTPHKVFDTLQLSKFEGWKPKDGTRMFKYGDSPTTQVWEFSGIPRNGKVYRTTDYRLFFIYENAWRQITEPEFEAGVKSGHEWGEMSVAEGNGIVQKIGGKQPSFVGTWISELRAIDQDRVTALKKQNWQTTIPSAHVKL